MGAKGLPARQGRKRYPVRGRFEIRLHRPWTTRIEPRLDPEREIEATLAAGVVLLHEETDWSMQGCAGFENPVIWSRYRIASGEHQGAAVEAVEFLHMHWRMFDEPSMLRPVIPREAIKGS